MAATFQAIIKQIKTNQYAPVYFLQGEEPYFIDEIIHHIEAHAIDQNLRDFNQIVLYGKDTQLSTILSYAREFPMMAKRKSVIVKEAQDIPDLGKDKGQELLLNYINKPQPSTILVFGYKYKALDKRKKLAKAIDKQAILFSSAKLYDNQLPSWVEALIQSRNKKIDKKALHLMIENIGNNLTRITNEVDKMLINTENEPVITEDHVYKNIGISKEYNIFELQKAIALKNVMKANEIIRYFNSDPKSNPLVLILSNLFSFFNKVLLLHHTPDKSERSLSQVLGIHTFFVKEYIAAARNYAPQKVVLNIRHLKIADMKSKGIDYPPIPEGEILRELVFGLIH